MNKVHKINSKKAQDLFKEDNAILIDVREPAEFRAQRIEGSHNIPLSKIKPNSIQDMRLKDQKIILHCKSGKRAKEASEKVSSELPFDLYIVEGGLDDLSNAGFNVITSNNNFLPLDRQIQLIVSLMILIGLAIYYFISPFGLILPLFASLGLMTSALTGWCGMAKFLALMPWNQ